MPLLILLEAPCSPALHDPGSLEEKHVEDHCTNPLSVERKSTEKSGCSSHAMDEENKQESMGTAHRVEAIEDAIESSDDTFQHGESFFVTQVICMVSFMIFRRTVICFGLTCQCPVW